MGSGEPLHKQLLAKLNFKDECKRKLVDFGQGMPWLPAQDKLRKTRGLPLAGPSERSQASLTQQARIYGFNLTVRVPPALHLSGLEDAFWEVEEAATWDKLMQLMPSDESQLAYKLLQLCHFKISCNSLVAQVEGWHGLWEVAILTLQRDLEAVFSEADIKVLITAMTHGFRPTDAPPGTIAAGACAIAALWWLMCQPKFCLKQPDKPAGVKPDRVGEHKPLASDQAAASASSQEADIPLPELPAAPVHQPPSAFSIFKDDTRQPDKPTASSAAEPEEEEEAGAKSKLRKRKSVYEMAKSVQGSHVGQLQVVSHAPQPYQILAGLLGAGCLKAALAGLRTLHQGLSGPQAKKLGGSFRKPQIALSATWAVGMVWQASSIKYIRNVLSQLCGQEISRQLGGASAEEKDGPKDLMLGGVEPEGLWSCLISTAAMPAWLHAPREAHMLLPMSWEEAVRVIQRFYKVRCAKRRLNVLLANMRATLQQTKGARALHLAVNGGPVLSDADREAGRIAMARLAILQPTEPLPVLRKALSRYFEFNSGRHPGVAAAEALLHILQCSHQHLQHFFLVAELPFLIRLLKPELPLRTQMLGCCLVSSFFCTTSNLGLQAWLTPNRGADVHSLLPNLQWLVQLEADEMKARCGPNPPPLPVGPHPRNYKPPPLADHRWANHGSKACVHAAVCVWGCARLLAAEQQAEFVRTVGLNSGSRDMAAALLWTQPLMLTAGQLSHRHKSVRSVLQMAYAALQSAKTGPASQILGVSCIVLAYERTCLPLLLLLGIADKGDLEHDPELDAAGKRKGQRQPSLIRSKPRALWGCIPHSQGLVGALVDAQLPIHSESAAAIIALIALADNEAKEQLVPLLQRQGSHDSHGSSPLASRKSARLNGTAGTATMSPFTSPAGQDGLGTGIQPCASARTHAGSARFKGAASIFPKGSKNISPKPSKGGPTLRLPADGGGTGGWSQRLLNAGHWGSLCTCLSSLPGSSQLQQVVSIGLMYLSRQINATYHQCVADYNDRLAKDKAQQGSNHPDVKAGGDATHAQGSHYHTTITPDPVMDRAGSPGTLPGPHPARVPSPTVFVPGTDARASHGSIPLIPARLSLTSVSPGTTRIDSVDPHMPRKPLNMPNLVIGEPPDPRAMTGSGHVTTELPVTPAPGNLGHLGLKQGLSLAGLDIGADTDQGDQHAFVEREDVYIDLQPMYRLLMGEQFYTLEESLKVLPQLLYSSDDHVLLFAALTVHKLALISELKEPLGEVGCVAALVRGVRRWIDMDGSDQRAAVRVAEWTMEALAELMRGPKGTQNVQRFTAAWKPVNKEEAARQQMNGFGYSMHVVPGSKPAKPTRTRAELIGSTLWQGMGWGAGQVMDANLTERLGKWNSKSFLKASLASSITDPTGATAAVAEESRSAVDPIQLVVQVVDVKPRQKSQFLHIKLAALAVLQITGRVPEYRLRMVEAEVGTQLARVSADPGYDSPTRAAASQLWFEISETPEGHDPRWWGCMVPAADLAKAGGDAAALNRLLIVAQSQMCVQLLSSGESEQQVVGARNSALLLCKGPVAKEAFLQLQGLACLLRLAGRPSTALTLLAPVCNALMNLSSHVPVQVDMAKASMRVLLHLNSIMSGLNGCDLDWRAIEALSGLDSDPDTTPTHTPAVTQTQDALVAQLLFYTSGALWNLSRHPDNKHFMYALELEIKTRTAAADQLNVAANLATPSANTFTSRAVMDSLESGQRQMDLLKHLLATAIHVQLEADAPKEHLEDAQDDIAPLPSPDWTLTSPRSEHQGFSSGSGSIAPAQDLQLPVAGAGPLPALPTLKNHLRQPMANMWAPILVDVHNAPAQPLFKVASSHEAPAAHGAAPAALPQADDAVRSARHYSNITGQKRSVLKPHITSVARPRNSTRWSPSVTAALETASAVQGQVNQTMDQRQTRPATTNSTPRNHTSTTNKVPNSRSVSAPRGVEDVLMAFDPPAQRARVKGLHTSVAMPDGPEGSLWNGSQRTQATDSPQGHGMNRPGTAQSPRAWAAVGAAGVGSLRSPRSVAGGTRTSLRHGLELEAKSNMLDKFKDVVQQMDNNMGQPGTLLTGSLSPSLRGGSPHHHLVGHYTASQTGPWSTAPPTRATSVVHGKTDTGATLDAGGVRADAGSLIAEFEHPSVDMWEHIEGSHASDHMFTRYCLPSGVVVNMYRHRKTRVDEMAPPGRGDGGDDMGGAGPSMEGLDKLARQLLKRCTELPFKPELPQLNVPEPPEPGTSTLPDLGSLNCLDAVLRPKDAAKLQEAAPEVALRKPWRLEDSIFAPRPLENDSKGWYDRDGISRDVFEHDWRLCSTKERFGKFIGKWAKGDALDAAKAALSARYEDLLKIFDFYASLGAGDPFAMHIVSWGQLMQETDVADESSSNCKLSDLDRVFLATNFEEDKQSQASQLNLDNALMRHEFLEAVIRVAVTKFLETRGKSGRKKTAETAVVGDAHLMDYDNSMAIPPASTKDLPPLSSLKKCKTLEDACTRLLDYYLLPKCAPECWLSSNAWRKERLYTEDVDILLQEKRFILEPIYHHYRQLMNSTDTKVMDIPEFLELLTETSLYHRYFNVREARLSFIWSRMRCFDESSTKKAYQRARALTFLEFLECLGRVADMFSPPPPADLALIGCTDDHPTTQYYQVVSQSLGYLPDRPSADLLAPKTRPLDEKLDQLLEVLVDGLLAKFQARNIDVLINRLKQGRGKTYQLGKSGM